MAIILSAQLWQLINIANVIIGSKYHSLILLFVPSD